MRHYIDSGIDWIGKIPEGWRINKFKHLFRIKKILAGKLGYDVLSVTQQGLKVKNIISNEGQVANDYTNYQLVFPNDFVMNHMDLLTGYVDVSKQEGVTSPDYRTFYAINPKDVINQYYLYIFQFCYKTRLFYNLGQGVSNFGRWRLPAEQQKEFVLPYPPVSEQLKIVDYLNEKCGKIDSLISLQEQMIEKLTAYKQSVISETVTKGLDPNAKLVPSGINWIGKYPENWTICRFKNLHDRANVGESIDKEYCTENTSDTLFYTAGIKPIYTSYKDFPEWKYVKEKDLLLSRNGTPYVYLPLQGAVYSDHIIRTPIKDEVLKEYVRYCLQQAISTVVVDTVSIATWSVSVWDKQFLPFPSMTEQKQIVNYLNEKCSDIDYLITLKQKKIEILKDYKKSVIYEAVTGKSIIE